ncbi:MAG TPA: phosphatidylglycerol lysyltransferase domain-containing protein [Methanoregulaceae archaeon]|nr:phosphatidylglycerol lysyltransferase domain-containing protein [Methanoregulaceae archaeon]
MLSTSDFSPVRLEDRPLFVSHYQRFPQVHSDNTFSNMFCWNSYAHYRFAQLKENIIISSTIEGNTSYRPPIGPRDPELLADLFDLCIHSGNEIPLSLVDATQRAWILSEYPDLPLYPDRDYFEYVYRTEDLASLPGKNYLSIRRHLNRFRNNCKPVVEPLEIQNLDEVTDFLIEWCEWKNCESEPFLGHEKEAMICALSHMAELGMRGLLIRIVGKVGAISLFESLNEDTLVVHFEKGLPDCEGIYKAINAETAFAVKEKYRYTNRESDMGVPGLREAKMRYHPHHMVEVWYATLDDMERIL